MGFFYFLMAAAVLGAILLGYMIYLAFENNLIEQELLFSDFPESFGELRVFFISDIHKRLVDESLVNSVKGRVDIVIIGGDLREKGVPLSNVETNILKLKSLGPVFFVWGNNDYEGEYRALDHLLLSHGVKILDNTATSFESVNGDKLVLLGVDDLGLQKDRLDLALLDAGEGDFKVLVSHNPEIIKKIEPEQGISLVLSGHTHGGQIRIAGFGPYQKGGIRKVGNLLLLTSNGYGTTMLPLRLGAKSECHLLTIRNG
ncbi:metallophosphoesterase [Bacillus sp. FJAT-27225]|uniref:metallophosphoesterase n=1 Tax=Bacillus sp. FJAT-27225 TaxID=1743144 RepID=UPI00080C34B8|nr:metallophosphoesterase [Bacillus sp. FJAT-27225]OCA90958.1 metallophosphoesterase [Bacillus sp. FJAT-27225]